MHWSWKALLSLSRLTAQQQATDLQGWLATANSCRATMELLGGLPSKN